MPRTDYSSTEVARIAGVTYRTLDRWLNEDVVSCDVPAEGTGSRRRFEYRDVVFVIFARTLKDQGLPIAAVRGLIRAIRSAWTDDEPAHAGCLVVDSWSESTSGLWVPDAARVAEFLPSIRESGISRGERTGVLLIVDLAYLAQRAKEALAAVGRKGAA